jgi:hypothetical protein
MKQHLVWKLVVGVGLSASLGVAVIISLSGSTAEGEARGAAFADLEQLANEATLDALKCAQDAGVKDAYITSDGGIMSGPNSRADIVPKCFEKMLDQSKYASLGDESEAVMRSTYEGYLVIHQCMIRDGFETERPPSFEDWMSAGRTWNPYNDLVKAGDLARLEAASTKCE